MLIKVSFKVQASLGDGFWKDKNLGIPDLDRADKIHQELEAARPDLDYRVVKVTEELV